MSLSLSPLYESMVRQFGTITSDERFKEDFVHSVNLCLDELSFCSHQTTAIAHVDQTNDTVSELDSDHMFILHDGLVTKLIECGQTHNGGDGIYDRALAKWEDRKGDFMVDQSRADQATRDDDGTPTADIIGLGYQGDEDGTGETIF